MRLGSLATWLSLALLSTSVVACSAIIGLEDGSLDPEWQDGGADTTVIDLGTDAPDSSLD